MKRRIVRHFRRLPPFLQVVSILGPLLPTASLAVLIPTITARILSLPLSAPLALWDSVHTVWIALNLTLLGGACTIVVNTYRARFRHPDRGPFPLSSWQSQARTLALLAALPLCALALTIASPPDSLTSFFAGIFSVFGALIMLMASIWALAEALNSELAPEPPMH